MYGSVAIKLMRAIRDESRRGLARRAGISEKRLLAIEYGAPASPDELRRIWTALAEDRDTISSGAR